MKAHRRGIPCFTWFKLAVCLCLAAMAASLFTPYPAQIIRALKGEPEQEPSDSGAILRRNPALWSSRARSSPPFPPCPERNWKIPG